MSLVLLQASGLKSGDDPMDLALMKAGRDAGKTLRFLESADEQIDLVARTFDAKASPRWPRTSRHCRRCSSA